MNLRTITDTEAAMQRLNVRLGSMLEPDMRESLERAVSILAEVRHFAVCWADAAVMGSHEEAARVVASRQASIDRLVQTVRPE